MRGSIKLEDDYKHRLVMHQRIIKPEKGILKIKN